MIVENGIGLHEMPDENGMVQDDTRIAYLRAHIEQMKKAVDEDGVDLIGYYSPGPIDLVSAGTGEMEKRYGFIYVDKDNEGKGTLARSQTHRFQATPNLSGGIRTSYDHLPNDIQVLPSGRALPRFSLTRRRT